MSRTTRKGAGLVASLAIVGFFGPGVIPTSVHAQSDAACLESWREVCADARTAPERRACMKEHADALPAECVATYRDAIGAARENWRKVHRACKDDFVNGVCKNSGGQIDTKVACLKENAESIAPACTQALEAWEKLEPDSQ